MPRLPEYGRENLRKRCKPGAVPAGQGQARGPPRQKVGRQAPPPDISVIRSAERRRWAADLTGPGRGGLVIYGMGGIGKSTLAAQIATRVRRLQSGRVITVVNGEVSASAPRRAQTDFIVLDNSTTTWRRIRAGG
ncbi:MAG: hypothetical protein ACRDPF_17045 [Streptosporangiaceae bacterium]